MTAPTTHCQICGRAIKTVAGYGPLGGGVTSDQEAGRTDRIAHHGYQRPHQQGYQTGSCDGARWRPYEVACDAIPPAIKQVEDYAERRQAGLDKLLSDPPETLRHYGRHWPRKTDDFVDLVRPVGFDPKAKRATWMPATYEAAFFHAVSAAERDVKGAREHAKYLKERLAAWVAPAQQEQVA